jgi:ElaB/YqjD/DUF883 family membrane-anchored ribosome-binding protein
VQHAETVQKVTERSCHIALNFFTKGVHMADVHETTRINDPLGTNPIKRQESQPVSERREMLRETGKELSQKAQDLTTQGKEIATEYYEQGREQVLAWQHQLENQVRAKPLQALLIAGGIGALFALLRRR